MLTETTVRELYELTFGADIEKDQIEYVYSDLELPEAIKILDSLL